MNMEMVEVGRWPVDRDRKEIKRRCGERLIRIYYIHK